MSQFRKAVDLADVAAAFRVFPLPSGDPRYVDVSEGRGARRLREKMAFDLDSFRASDGQFAKVVFTGHRGCGKSTELRELEHEIADRFTSLHVEAEDSLVQTGDFDYPDLFLWVVDELVKKFEADGKPLHADLIGDVALWFAEVTLTQTEKVESKIDVEAQAELGFKAWLAGIGAKLLARVRSIISGSVERRKEIRRTLQSRPDELIRRVDLLLDQARLVLRNADRPSDLLIVVDNLDRLPPEAAESLFFRNGDFLKRPRAHVIYTVPIAAAVAPLNIANVFPLKYTLPMIEVRDARGKSVSKGLDALVEIVAARADLDAAFASPKVARTLAEMSGGSVRDLMRLVMYAARNARVDGRSDIDAKAAREAIQETRVDLQKHLIPDHLYYPLLARIHETKRDSCLPAGETDPEKIGHHQLFFAKLLTQGFVLEYNGGDNWFDVHPIIRDIKAFQEALADVQASQADREGEGGS